MVGSVVQFKWTWKYPNALEPDQMALDCETLCFGCWRLLSLADDGTVGATPRSIMPSPKVGKALCSWPQAHMGCMAVHAAAHKWRRNLMDDCRDAFGMSLGFM